MAAKPISRRPALTVLRQQFLRPNRSSKPFPPLRYASPSQISLLLNPSSSPIPRSSDAEKPKSQGSKTAKAMASLINSNPWSSHLQSSLSSLSPSISTTTVSQTLRRIKTPTQALKFFNWAEAMGFSHNAQSFFMLLEIFGRNRNLNAARNLLFSIEKRSNGKVKLEDRFFNSLIRSYGDAGLFQESVKLFGTMKTMGISASVVSFNSLLSILLKRGRTSLAKNVYDEMLGMYGVTPDTHTFNILIRGFCLNSMVDEGFHYFKEMSRLKCEPDVVTYNTIVDGLCRAGKVEIARNVVKGMRKRSGELNPNVVTYTTLIRGYCVKEDVDEALCVLEEMSSQGLKPNEITYNTLLKGLCEAKKLDKVKEVLEGTMRGEGFTPDTCTLNTLMHSHCNAGNLEEAFKVFTMMSELQVPPDSATYSVLIRSLCQRRDYGKAEELFDELSKKQILLSDHGCTPVVASYKPIFEYLCSNGRTKKADEVFRQLLKRGTQDPPSYKTLIMGHCREGTFEAGYKLLVLMLRRDYVPDVEIYDSLIDGLLEKGKPLLAQQTLEKMLKSSHLPETSTFHSILAALLEMHCARESASFVILMLEKNIRQNINLSTDLIRLLFSEGLRDKAFEIVGMLYDNGYSIKIEEVVSFLYQSRKLIEACEILRFSLRKQENVSIDIFDQVILGLCNINKLREAFGLYHELIENGDHQQLPCLHHLKSSLEVAGRSVEADFVSKRMPKHQLVNKSGKSRPQL
ncbi:pentatricopeptide repeat-containing protein At1g02060, chloroplastic isoform X2 [Rosa rugosa]|nr:pentatricopeptide repeat-containing protein At1g02060, chloroplastic isoform X2 [Rosa rugosa]